MQSEVSEWIAGDASQALIEIDRWMVQRGGLRKFMELAWHTVEPEGRFRANWHIDAIAEHLEGVSRGHIRRLLITVPPRMMKSLSVAVFWPAWDWIDNPERRFLFASYAQALSFRDSLSCRNVIRSDWYQARWGDRFSLRPDQNQVEKFSNSKTGYRQSTSVDAKATGLGGDFVCLPGDQAILTEAGAIAIGDLVLRRATCRVWSFDTATGEVALKPIAGWHSNPGRPILRVTLNDGSSFRCTGDHRIWTRRGWVEARFLQASDAIPRAVESLEADDRAPLLVEVVSHADITFCLTVADHHTMIVPGGVILANCVDDPHNVTDAESDPTREGTLRWWDEVMPSRINDPKTGAFLIIQQRVHHSDLAGHVLARKGGAPYEHLCLPAEFEPDHPHRWFRDPRREEGELLWPDHMPREELENLKATLGPYAAAGQLQQRPTPREGGMFKRAWFPTVGTIAPDTTNWSRAWDLAASVAKLTKSDPDYSATVRIGFSPSRKRYIIVHVARWREGPGKVRELILEHATADGYRVKQTVPKDPGQAGVDQAQQLAAMLSAWDVTAEPPSGDKATRAAGLAGQAEVGNVELLEGDWNEMFLTEMSQFPRGAHDDMLDAAASAYNRIRSTTTGIITYYEEMEAAHRAQREIDAERERRILAGEMPSPPGITEREESVSYLGRVPPLPPTL